LGKTMLVILVLATAFRLWMALYGSQGVVADETFVTLRQGRSLWEGQGYLFQPGVHSALGQPISLYGLFLTPIMAFFGNGTPTFLLAFNTLLWTIAVLTVLRPLRPSVRPTVALLLCLAPAFVDGAIQGTSAEWLGFLLALCFASISVGRTAQSLMWFTLAVLSSPSMLFAAPVWIGVHFGRCGKRFGFATLTRFSNALANGIPV